MLNCSFEYVCGKHIIQRQYTDNRDSIIYNLCSKSHATLIFPVQYWFRQKMHISMLTYEYVSIDVLLVRGGDSICTRSNATLIELDIP